MVILDTSIIIDHLRREDKKDSIFTNLVSGSLEEEVFSISMLSVQELFEGKSTKDEKREESLISTIANLNILPYDYEVAKFAGEIARDLSRPPDFVDCAIAATAIINDAKLATLNKKDFESIAELKLI